MSRAPKTTTPQPDINGAYAVAGWDVQQTGAGDWRASVIDEFGDYLESEYFETRGEAFRHAKANPRAEQGAR